MQHVFCEVRTKFLHTVKIKFRLRTVHVFTLLTKKILKKERQSQRKIDENEEE